MEKIESLEIEIQTLKNENAQLNTVIKGLKTNRNLVSKSRLEQDDYHESQIRFRTIFETSRLGNKVISSDLKILDYAPEEFHQYWKLLQKKLWETNMPSFTLETCLRKKDGSIIWCQVNSILFKDNGKTLGYTTIEDVSEQHELKQQRENFISIASHELKTPLTSLQAYLQVMHRIIENDTVIDDRLRKLSANSIRSISKLAALVGDLLDSTKISKGQLNLNISNFNVSELVNKCCNHIRTEGKYNITYKGDLSMKISADEQKIDQVLVNLVNNAVKYAPESKEIVVEVQDLGSKVKIAVIDFGKGISKDKIPFLFNSYYQVETVEKKKIQGLGLGLYISSEIMKKHNGEIGVDSEIGKGSTFWITLPKG
jgi:signal transduction histidine kinase